MLHFIEGLLCIVAGYWGCTMLMVASHFAVQSVVCHQNMSFQGLQLCCTLFFVQYLSEFVGKREYGTIMIIMIIAKYSTQTWSLQIELLV